MATKKRHKERQVFAAGIESLLKARGAQPATQAVGIFGITYQWVVETPHGLVFFTIENDQIPEFLGTVFGRFNEPVRGKHLGCNPYSGKWNQHYLRNWTAETAIEHFEWMLGKLFAAQAAESERSS